MGKRRLVLGEDDGLLLGREAHFIAVEGNVLEGDDACGIGCSGEGTFLAVNGNLQVGCLGAVSIFELQAEKGEGSLFAHLEIQKRGALLGFVSGIVGGQQCFEFVNISDWGGEKTSDQPIKLGDIGQCRLADAAQPGVDRAFVELMGICLQLIIELC